MIKSDAQLLEVGEVVVLFELDATQIGGNYLKFHGYQEIGAITWQGKEYTAWPILAEGFARTSAQQPAPTLAVGNVDGAISALCIHFDDLVGAKLTRHTTLGKYLDAVNFSEGNPSADPSQEFPVDVWTIEQKTSETSEAVEFELASALNFQGTQLPRRQIVANVCTWLSTGGYRGTYCGYTGAAMFDKDGNPVASSALDRCGGKLSDCKKRFGENNILNFGSFPAAGMLS
ncbi:phage minor tail protein L [Solimicrobium silvestre]|uniref:Phage minor tail protein L n=1 Tax=Solimicrobium silvestre TaxID=2099400 RepID=A0A2S9GZD3_9BURK|nr:phage minor tail protein L [Solimicrobium silvestre]PRC93095.1 Phage minor tail protein L [Solimicrobium silvestre]